jgi:hypothetical protein
MHNYTILLRRQGLIPERDIVILKDGFCWPAFLVGGLWALWHRMWWVALGLLVGAAVLSTTGPLLFADKISPQILTTAFALLAGVLAHDLRVWALERKGFVDCGTVSAGNQDDALKGFLENNDALAGIIGSGEAAL